MKILLIQPPYTIFKNEPKTAQPPLGLCYIASVLAEKCSVRILDAIVEDFDREEKTSTKTLRYGMGFHEIAEEIKSFEPTIVGVSCLFSAQSGNAHAICEIAKQVNGAITTVMGGAHPSSLPETVLSEGNVDFVIIGEGEESFSALVEAIDKKRDYSVIDGLAYRTNTGKILINPKTCYISDLDALPLPARHLLPMEKYFAINRPHGVVPIGKPSTPMITSRGCPFRCSFCSIHSVWGRKYRARSAEKVLDEIGYLVKTYGIKEIQFEDDNLTLNRQRACRIFDGIVQRQFKISWSTPNGIAMHTLTNDLLKKMKESGCHSVCLSIESGDESTLKKEVRKPLKLEAAKPIIKELKTLGIESNAFFIVGFPGESLDSIQNTFRFANTINADNLNFFVATPYPGTEMYEKCKKQGLISDKMNYENLRVKMASAKLSEIDTETLERMIAKKLLGDKLRMFLKPKMFYRKVVRRFFTNPFYFINTVFDLMRKVVLQK